MIDLSPLLAMTASSGFKNFRDPVGLVRRMLRSGDGAARAALLRAAATPMLQPVDSAMQVIERRTLRRYGEGTIRHPIVHIVGGPRSGTTLVYQVLAATLPVAFFTNLSALFPRSPITAMRLLERRRPARTAEFRSYYGNTRRLGEPNDAFHVWNRWLGVDRYEPKREFGAAAVADMRRFFAACTGTFDRPLLNKNNRNAACIPELYAALPESIFVVVRRDLSYTAQSLIVARETIQGSRLIGWGLASRDADPRSGTYLADVCDQVRSIDGTLTAAAAHVPAERFIEVSYEAFCADPSRLVAAIHLGVFGRPPPQPIALSPLPCQNRVTLPASEFAAIRDRLAATP